MNTDKIRTRLSRGFGMSLGAGAKPACHPERSEGFISVFAVHAGNASADLFFSRRGEIGMTSQRTEMELENTPRSETPKIKNLNFNSSFSSVSIRVHPWFKTNRFVFAR